MAHFENMRLKQETKRSLEKMDEDLERYFMNIGTSSNIFFV